MKLYNFCINFFFRFSPACLSVNFWNVYDKKCYDTLAGCNNVNGSCVFGCVTDYVQSANC